MESTDKSLPRKILSGTIAAGTFLWNLVRKYPKASFLTIGGLTGAILIYWRLNQPFAPMQLTLLWSGFAAWMIGWTALWLERRSVNPRQGALKMSFLAMLIGLALAYFGLRIT